jgi:hypothetical protein
VKASAPINQPTGSAEPTTESKPDDTATGNAKNAGEGGAVVSVEQSRALLETALANLRALFAGKWPAELAVQTVFAVNLDDLGAVTMRIRELGSELSAFTDQRELINSSSKTFDSCVFSDRTQPPNRRT